MDQFFLSRVIKGPICFIFWVGLRVTQMSTLLAHQIWHKWLCQGGSKREGPRISPPTIGEWRACAHIYSSQKAEEFFSEADTEKPRFSIFLLVIFGVLSKLLGFSWIIVDFVGYADVVISFDRISTWSSTDTDADSWSLHFWYWPSGDEMRNI